MNIGNTLYEIGGLGEEVRTWIVDDIVQGADGDAFVIATSGQYRMLARYSDLRARLNEQHDRRPSQHATLDKGRWRPYNPRHRGPGILPAEPDSDFDDLDRYVTPRRCGDLTVERTRSLKDVNRFLDHPALVSHDLGGTDFPVAMFAARSPHDGSIVGVCVLKKPSARALDDWQDGGPHNGGSGTRIEVARLACRVDRPRNTASWLLAKAARWADQQGFDVIQAYAGMAGNRGTCYDAAGFDQQHVEPDADGSAWNSADDRDGRVFVADGGEWTRRRWERQLGATA